MLDIDVLRSPVKLIVLGEGNGPLIVSVNNHVSKPGIVIWANLLEESLEPDSFFGYICLSNVLGLAGG
jgi:hypothetical protein